MSEEQTVKEEDQSNEDTVENEVKKKGKRRTMFGMILGLLIILSALSVIPIVKMTHDVGWGSNLMIFTYVVSGGFVAAVLGIGITLKTLRTRYSVEREIVEDRDVNEYIILWDYSRWVLYTPTMILAIAIATYQWLIGFESVPKIVDPAVLGGIWVGLACCNYAVQRHSLSIKVILIIIPSVGCVLLLTHLIGYADDLVLWFKFLKMKIPTKLYLISAGVIAIDIFIYWLFGLFQYIAITPNVADYQVGLTETGRQIKNRDYDVDFDATDVVERWLFGFGRIIISFPNQNRPVKEYFVPKAHKADDKIRRVRSVMSIDQANSS